MKEGRELDSQTESTSGARVHIDEIPYIPPVDDVSTDSVFTFLHRLTCTSRNWEFLEGAPRDGTWRIYHTDLDLSGFKRLIHLDLIEDSKKPMGRTANWRFTDAGLEMLELVEAGDFDDFVAPKYALCVFERHFELVMALPWTTTETFVAQDFDVQGALLHALNRANLITRVVKRTGDADTWATSELGIRLKYLALAFGIGDDLVPDVVTVEAVLEANSR